MAEETGGEDPAGAQTEEVDVVGAGDLADSVEGAIDRRGVGVEVPVGLLGGWVTPTDEEQGDAVGHRMLDEAALGRQIHEVVPADLRWDQEHGAAVDGRRRGRVLEDLADVVAVDDGTRGRRQGLADDEPGPVDGRRHPAVAHQIVEEVARAAHEAHPSRVPGLLQRRRVSDQGVGGGGRRRQQLDEELGPVAVAPAELRVADQLAERPRPGEVELHESPVAGVRLPGLVLEAPVARVRRDLGAAGRDPGGLDSELDPASSQHPGGAGEPARAGRVVQRRRHPVLSATR